MHLAERNIAIACNPFSKKAKVATESISLLLIGMDIRHQVFYSQWPVEWEPFSEVWLVGGDGTLNYFINTYPDTEIPIAIFKGGTGNDFHNLLYGIPTVEEQAERLLKRNIHYLDAGRCNGRLFINGVGIGFDGKVVEDLQSKNKGRFSYWKAIVLNILIYKEFHYSIDMGADGLTGKSFMISVANGKTFGGGFRVAPLAENNDGLLDLSIIGKMHPFKRVRYVPVIQKGHHLKLNCTTYLQTASLVLKSANEIPAHIDGEFFTSNHFIIDCLPKRFPFLL